MLGRLLSDKNCDVLVQGFFIQSRKSLEDDSRREEARTPHQNLSKRLKKLAEMVVMIRYLRDRLDMTKVNPKMITVLCWLPCIRWASLF